MGFSLNFQIVYLYIFLVAQQNLEKNLICILMALSGVINQIGRSVHFLRASSSRYYPLGILTLKRIKYN